MAKPRKVEEPSGTYSPAAKKGGKASAPAQRGDEDARQLDQPTANRLADKIFEERKHLLHKLAQ